MFGQLSKRIISLLMAAVLTAANVMPVSAGDDDATEASETIQETAVTEAETVPEEDDLTHQSFELYPDENGEEKVVTLAGMMPEGAEAAAVEVSSDVEGAAAYDITITAGETAYQPGEENPILVEITDPVITESITLWHIHDDGEREQLFDFTVEEGKVTFYATGFSVYEIVPATIQDFTGWFKITSMTDLDSLKDSPIYISSSAADNEKYHFASGEILEKVANNEGRTGLYKTRYAYSDANSVTISPATQEAEHPAVPFYFDGFELSTDKKTATTYIYCLGENEERKYVYNSADKSLNFTDKAHANTFTIKLEDTDKFIIQGNVTYANKYWNEQGGSSWGSNRVRQSFATYTKGTKLYFYTYKATGDDPFQLDGKTYGLMNYSGGAVGNGLELNEGLSALEMLSWVVRKDNTPDLLYVTEELDITEWTFHFVSDDLYTLTVNASGETKYLHIGSDSITVENTPQNIRIQMGEDGRIRLTDPVTDKYVAYASEQFTVNNTGTDLCLVRPATIEEQDRVTYSADKVSISDVPNHEQVIVYTRVWNENTDRYEFYAIDRDGHLVPCYERSDSIMWVGNRVNTLLWDFTEYYWEGTRNPNFYYELYNPYSGMYIAPKSSTGEVIADHKIGINLPGRRKGEYFSEILAWDDPSYAYAGLRAYIDQNNIQNSHIVTSARANADTFYFATMAAPKQTLTTVDTVDNNQYGITIKMIDYPNKGNNSTNNQDQILNDNSGFQTTGQTSGLLATKLEKDGNGNYTYPKTANGTHSLSELYNGATTVNHLFIQSIFDGSGYFEFDSCQNFATLRATNDNNFTVYKELGTTDVSSKSTLRHGQFFPYDTIQPGNYAQVNPYNLYSALASTTNSSVGLLPNDDPRKYEKLHNVGSNPNYYNGMELEASFIQTPNGKDNWNHDIIFEFTGDDDFWLYVDGELVIDLGGVHSALPGSVNFATGEVNVNGTHKTLRDIFLENAVARGEDTAAVEALFEPKQITKVVNNQTVTETAYVFKDYSPHTMKIFYMERGAGASNLHMRFNLSYVTPGHVTLSKKVTGTDDMDFEVVEFPYQIWYDEGDGHSQLLDNSNDQIRVTYQNSTKEIECKANYTPPGDTNVYHNVYFINPQRSVEIHFPRDTIRYKIIECGINSEVYDPVYINGKIANKELLGNAGRCKVESDWIEVAEHSSIVFENHVDPRNLRTLTFQKKLYDDEYTSAMSAEEKRQHEIHDDPSTFTFRLYLSDGSSEDLELTNMYKYSVTDPDGYYCSWDYGAQRFVSTTLLKNDIDSQLTTINDNIAHFDELIIEIDRMADPNASDIAQQNAYKLEREQLYAEKAALNAQIPVFESSMNGSISKIPGWYSVHVPNLPVGSRFRVEERHSDTERPLGYDRVEYERNLDTYNLFPGELEDSGWVKKDNSPNMNVINQRGYEIEAVKTWSDSDFARVHETIYTALFLKDDENDTLTLVPDTIRAIPSSINKSRHFLRSLAPGKTLADYVVCEVKINEQVENDNNELVYHGEFVPAANIGTLLPGPIVKVPTVDDTLGSVSLGTAEEQDGVTGYYVFPLADGVPTTFHSGATESNMTNHSYNVLYKPGNGVSSIGDENNINTRKDGITNSRDGGVDITLYDMKTLEPLSGGVFVLTHNGEELGIFTSNSLGLITTLYDYEEDSDYILTEENPPAHYIGLPNTMTFQIHGGTADQVTLSGNEPQWQNWERPAGTTDKLIAHINVYNKQFTLQALKQDSVNETSRLANAHFKLFRGVNGIGGLVKNYQPMPGYEDLVTDANGVIPKIDNTLEPGKYYLEEVTPPAGYKKLERDIVFTITGTDVVLNSQDINYSLDKPDENDEIYAFTLNIANEFDGADYYFDVEKMIFIDKRLHNDDREQKFVFLVERFADNETAFTNDHVQERFYLSLNCDRELNYTPAAMTYKADGTAYPYSFHTSPDIGGDMNSHPNSQLTVSGEALSVEQSFKKNGRIAMDSYPAGVWCGTRTVHVKSTGIYRVTEVTDWSLSDYNFWTGSNTYKGYGDGTKGETAGGFRDHSTTGDAVLPANSRNSVMINVAAVGAERFPAQSTTVGSTTYYRPTASFTNSETQFAYLTTQAYAENKIRISTEQGN